MHWSEREDVESLYLLKHSAMMYLAAGVLTSATGLLVSGVRVSMSGLLLRLQEWKNKFELTVTEGARLTSEARRPRNQQDSTHWNYESLEEHDNIECYLRKVDRNRKTDTDVSYSVRV